MNQEQFRQFVEQDQLLTDLWQNCPNSIWMLYFLFRRNYCNSEKVEQYIDWLRDQIKGDRNEEEAEIDLRRFKPHKGHIKQFEQEVKAGKMTQAEAKWRRFIRAWMTACSESESLLSQKVSKALRSYKYRNAEPGSEVDEKAIRIDGLSEQADKLRELLGDPFVSQHAEDFCSGRI